MLKKQNKYIFYETLGRYANVILVLGGLDVITWGAKASAF